MKYYLAYGSNLDHEWMKAICPGSVPYGVGILKGWKLAFKFHATIVPNANEGVPVVVWAISEQNEACLDQYEGYPDYYTKRNVEVSVKECETGKLQTVTAMVYIMCENHTIQPPTQSYYLKIARGYRDFGLDLQPLQDAILESIHTNESPNY